VADLARPGVQFINRQRGAGTRLLLDALLAKADVPPAAVAGYDREEYTHTAVAAAVAAGTAGCGLGIYAAARALGLGFLPLAEERYELVVPAENMADARVQALLETLREDEFRRALLLLGGYDASRTGEERWVG
jgi:putative molybdopterin biosynthesis protein